MIINPQDAGLNESKEPNRSAPAHEEPPPEYTPTDVAGSSAGHVDGPPPDFPLSSNWLFIRQSNRAIKQKFSLDPLLSMPECMLPPLDPSDEVRPNLKVQTSNASLNLSVYVYGDQPVKSGNRPRMQLDPNQKRPHTILIGRTSNAAVTLKLHECPLHSRSPLDINLTTSCAPVTLYLPRSFHGPLFTTTSYATTTFSPGLQRNLVTFMDVDGAKTSFVGDYTQWTHGQPWAGDNATITTTYAKIKVAYMDEAGESTGMMAGIVKLLGWPLTS